MWKAAGTLELCLFVGVVFKNKEIINGSATLQYDEGHFMKEVELEMKVCEEIKKPGVCCFVMLQFLILIAYIAGPTFWFRCATRWCKLNGTCGGQSVVWNLGSMETFTWSSLKWFQLVVVGMKKLTLFPWNWPQDSLRLLRFSFVVNCFHRGGASVTPPTPTLPFQSFSFRSIPMPGRERRAKAELNWGPAYKPSALPLGQIGSLGEVFQTLHFYDLDDL